MRAISALLSSIMQTATERANSGAPLKPILRLLMDEAANIAPLSDLPGHLSQAGAHGVRIATIWQSLGQLNHRYGKAAETILANSTTKLFMGPVGDRATWSYLGGLLGETPEEKQGERRNGVARAWPVRRPRAGPDALQQLSRGRAVLISGSLPPAVVGSSH